MQTTRFFSGARMGHKGGEASRMKKMEIMKGGKLAFTPAERYQRLIRKKIEEHNAKAQANPRNSFMLPGAASATKNISRKAQQAIAEISKRKAIKEEKELRQMVVIKPKRYYDNQGYFGRVDAKGQVFDEMENLVLRVDRKKGRVKTVNGFPLGKYKPKSWSHTSWMRDWITKNSPYHHRLRQMELQRQVAAMYGMTTMASSVYGAANIDVTVVDVHGQSLHGDDIRLQNASRNNLGITAWGVVSNNIHGTFGDNVHGTFSDNVWGRASTNIWGGIGDAGGVWGKPGARRIWGTGNPNQKNYIAAAFWGLASLFGIGGRLAARRNARTASAAARSSGGGRR